MNIDQANRVWELSAAYETYNAELRAQVVKVLVNFHAPGYNQWPANAVVTSVSTPRMQPSAMYNYVRLGQVGIHRSIPHDQMPVIEEWRWPNQGHFDAWFVVPIHGNADNHQPSDYSLTVYITTPNDLVVLELGCNHTDRRIVRAANQYTRYSCDTCGYTWGVDTSG